MRGNDKGRYLKRHDYAVQKHSVPFTSQVKGKRSVTDVHNYLPNNVTNVTQSVRFQKSIK